MMGWPRALGRGRTQPAPLSVLIGGFMDLDGRAESAVGADLNQLGHEETQGLVLNPGVQARMESPMSKELSVAPLSPAQQRIHAAALKLFAERGVTEVNVRDLALAAGVARGTIYNNLPEPERLFEQVAAQLADDMNVRITESFADVGDPAERLARGIRLYARRAHEEPSWGRFICRFAFSNASLQKLWQGQPLVDLMHGLQTGRYHFRPEQLHSSMSMVVGVVLASLFMVLEGIKTWRDAGSDAAELALIALGVPRAEARAIANQDLPKLPAAQES